MIFGRRNKRVLIYSHDSFGLGHLRRCREIAHALVDVDSELSVLILSGSPIIGSFDFRNRVDFVRIPGVIKLRNGDYTSLKLKIDTEQTLAMRASIIEHTAKIYDPDLFLVDKEPLGLRGEVERTLALLKERGTPCVLGLRDVMDEPALLAPEWERKQVVPALEEYFDDIWVYGLPQIYDPLEGVALPDSVRRRMTYTGYLGRSLPQATPSLDLEKIDKPYLLITVGGGGDHCQVAWTGPGVGDSPTIISSSLQVSFSIASFYGGTGLLIAVSVAFDLVQKIDSHLVMRNYRGLLE